MVLLVTVFGFRGFAAGVCLVTFLGLVLRCLLLFSVAAVGGVR